MAVTAQPQLYVNGVALNNWFSNEIVWEQTEGLFDGTARQQGATLSTFDGPGKVRAHDMAYRARRVVITGRLINRSGWLDKQKAIAELAQTFAGKPAIVRLGTLYLQAEFGEVKPVQDAYSHLPGYLTYRVEGEAIPGTFFGQYHTAVGADQGLAVQDDRPDSSAVKFVSNSFTYNAPGTAPTEACVALTGTASTTYYLKGRGLRRVPMTTDANGNAYIDEASAFIVYPGANAIRVEDSAGALAAGVTAVNLYGTRPRFLGNTATAATTQSATTNRMAEGPMLTPARTGSASYISTAGTLTTATDGQARIGLPYVIRRNFFSVSSNFESSTWGTSASVTKTGNRQVIDGRTYYEINFTSTTGGSLSQTISGLTGSARVISVYAFAGTKSAIKLRLGTSATETTKTLTTTPTRIEYTATPGGTEFGLANDATIGTSGTIWVADAQLETGSTASAYQATGSSGVDLTNSVNGAGLVLEGLTVNKLSSPNDFTNAAWTKSAATVGAAGITDPLGTLTAYKLLETTATSSHFMSQSVTISGTIATDSIYLKAAERSWAIVQLIAGASMYAFINLSTGAVGTTVGSPTVRVMDAGNGWWRIAISGSGLTAGTAQIIVYPSTGDGTISYTGDSTKGIYVWRAQFEENPFPTSWVDGTRQADLCGIVSPHNLLKYSEDLTKSSAWTVSGMAQPTKSGANNTINFDSVNDYIYQSLAPSGFAGRTHTFAVKVKAGTLSGQFSLGFGNQVGALIAQTTINTSQLSALEARTFYLTATIPTDATAFWCYIQNNSGTGTLIVESVRCVEGSHPGIYVRTTDTAIAKPADATLDPAWVQNGSLELDLLPHPNASNSTYNLLGSETFDVNTKGTLRLANYGTNDVRFQRKHNSSTGTGGAPGRGQLQYTTSIYDGAKKRIKLVWMNYTLNGVRVMTQELWVDGTKVGTQDVASLYGATSWLTPDATVLLSDGNTYATISAPSDGSPMFGYPTLPANAIPAA